MASRRKEAEPTFYRAWHRQDELEPGIRMALERSVEFDSYQVDRSDLSELVKLPLSELQARRKAGVSAEKTIMANIQAAAQEWETQAARTMLLDRAIEYIKTPQVKHTSNKWKQQENGVWEISNRVYIMRYQITQMTEGDKKGQWLVTWGIAVHRPQRPSTEKYYYVGDTMVVEQKKKYYNAEADAQHYIQSRFDVYAHLFTELSPPIPDKFKRPFFINGVLLPGYTVAPRERPPQEVAEELLLLLHEGDIAELSAVEQEAPDAPAAPSPEQTPPNTPEEPKPQEQTPPPIQETKPPQEQIPLSAPKVQTGPEQKQTPPQPKAALAKTACAAAKKPPHKKKAAMAR